MIDTICCVLLGLIMAFFAYGHLTQPEETFEQLFGFPVESPLQAHFVAVLGGNFACISITLLGLGLFQPSSNARKFVLAGYAVLQYYNIMNQYRFPVKGEDDPPESMAEMPIPLLIILMSIALFGVLFGRTDGQRAELVRNKKKAQLYAKHAQKVSKKE
ncbi:expressed unknown protein [Seminavis robusta]|uniref:Uncharacterized protein n=1 Tax=Seminavis robusta TaxID=568900 RepID=A0A9N8EZH9_9STRA|nr:expressed unknown protein [Seminavis robusta]|eukprot:Sro2321_g323230.1 n/a (159) ;mRNA; f:14900-15483